MISSDTFSLTDVEQSRFAQVQRLSIEGHKNIMALLPMLTDPSWIIRRSVVEALADIGDSAVEPLVASLREQRDSETRIAAVVDALAASKSDLVEKKMMNIVQDADPAIVADVAQILGRRRSPSVLTTLVALTQHSNDNVSVSAIEALGRLGGRAAVEALIEIISGKNFFRVFPAIDVLGRSGDPRAVAPLIKLLADPTYLPEVSRALGRSGEIPAVAPLVELLRSSSDAVVRVAAQSLWDLRDKYQEKAGGDVVMVDSLIRAQTKPEMIRRLSAVLPQSDIMESVAICNLMGIAGDEAATPALTLALDGESAIATNAAIALKKMGQNSETLLLNAIRSGSSEQRKVLLPLVTRSAAAHEVTRCFVDPDSEVRALACDTLARLGNAKVVQEIFHLLEDENLRVVHSATAAIQALGSREARELAVQAVDSSHPVVRRSALRILSYFGDISVLKSLLKGLKDSDARVQEAAIQGLPVFGNQEALDALVVSAQSETARIRALSMRALGQWPNESETVYALLNQSLKDKDPWTRYYACQSLGRLKHGASSAEVALLLNDEAGQVRVAAVEALSHFNSSVAHEALRKAAQSQDLEVRRAALVGLGISHRMEDLPILLSAMSLADVATRLMALAAIAKFPSERVLSALNSAASDVDEQVSTSALTFLGERSEQEATEVLVELLAKPSLAERAKAALLTPSEGRAAGLLVKLDTADHELSAVLVSILSRLQRPEARFALLSCMRLHNVAARKAVAPALAARRDFEMMAALQEAAENDPDPEVKRICLLLLRQ